MPTMNRRRLIVGPLLGTALFAFGPSCAMGAPVRTTAATPAPAAETTVQILPAGVTQISRATYRGSEAIRLTDGRTEAIIVPSIGRLMRYGLVGGENWLWNADTPPKYGA